MNILLLGKNGQVGWALQRALQPLGRVYAFGQETKADGLSGDITDFDGVARLINQIKPDVVVNAAAYTAVDRAEQECEQAEQINHHAVRHLAAQCREINALLVHYSTDYVFNGQGCSPWHEDNETAPLNIYGQSKRAGEIALENSGARFLNFRTSWVYGVHGSNFIKTMLKLAKTKDTLNIINDQIGAPTGADLIADITAHAVHHYFRLPENERETLMGTYHLAAAGETTWYEYANFIFQAAREQGYAMQIKQVSPITTANYPTPAVRPLNSRLDTQKLRATFSLHLPEWQIGVKHAINDILESKP
ncbi:dTDP-4-dehydrorhamnose reductase [Stenoxybacter acetivorans]|uniref:dTDP-4-dehydrorhamnose reductase n=1 Tax=Stenoxybacter acetivorans TaxID=422441 RepID=UPI00056265F5|nr:dTDP-4-dehydrorhamnose reductase [Stenoxybacter acetivorans]